MWIFLFDLKGLLCGKTTERGKVYNLISGHQAVYKSTAGCEGLQDRKITTLQISTLSIERVLGYFFCRNSLQFQITTRTLILPVMRESVHPLQSIGAPHVSAERMMPQTWQSADAEP